MGQISQEVYLVKICHFFSKFGQSVLENGRLWRLKSFPPVLVKLMATWRHNSSPFRNGKVESETISAQA